MKTFHVIPADDIGNHIDSKDCLCRPFLRNAIWIHNAWDKREYFEEDNDKFRKGKYG